MSRNGLRVHVSEGHGEFTNDVPFEAQGNEVNSVYVLERENVLTICPK